MCFIDRYDNFIRGLFLFALIELVLFFFSFLFLRHLQFWFYFSVSVKTIEFIILLFLFIKNPKNQLVQGCFAGFAVWHILPVLALVVNLVLFKSVM